MRLAGGESAGPGPLFHGGSMRASANGTAQVSFEVGCILERPSGAASALGEHPGGEPPLECPFDEFLQREPGRVAAAMG